MTNKSLLMIAYYYPPCGGAGVQRSLIFSRYLPDFGWTPVILTTKRNPHQPTDDTLIKVVPSDIAIFRTPSINLLAWLPYQIRKFMTRWMFLVDEQIDWLPFGIAKAKILLRSGSIRAIFSSSSPYTSHLIGLQLKQLFDVPWLADFRDPWVGGITDDFPTGVHRRAAQNMEKRVITGADRVIVNTETTANLYLNRYPMLDPSHIVVIPNGYDPADFLPEKEGNQKNSSLIIVHSGTLYQTTRSAAAFLQALWNLIEGGQINPYKIRVEFVGRVDKRTQYYAEKPPLNACVDILHYVPHEISIEKIRRADLLLLIPSAGPGSDLYIPAKIYEYLAARKTILMIGNNKTCQKIIEEAEAGHTVMQDNIESIESTLLNLYKLWETGALACKSNLDSVKQYSRYKQTGQLAAILDQINTKVE